MEARSPRTGYHWVSRETGPLFLYDGFLKELHSFKGIHAMPVYGHMDKTAKQ